MDFAVALTLVQTLLQLLCSSYPLRRELESIWGYKSQLKKLENTMYFIQVVLEAERQQRQRLQPSYPLQASLQVVLDDLFDAVATLVQRKKLMSGNMLSKEVNIFFSRFNQLIYAFTMSREVKKIRKTLDGIAKDHRQFGSILTQQGSGQTSQDSSNSRETNSLVSNEDVIIGRDNDKQVLIDMLLHTAVEGRVSCVSIVGIGGLGKTTLAQLVYNDEKIKREFQLKMWVCVSNNFDVKAVLGEILAAATNESKQGSLSMDQLHKSIQRELYGKKYLLVLDDVWGDVTGTWNELRRPLIRDGSRGSRILVTTRLANMEAIVGGKTHELKSLSEAESWNLFERFTLKTRYEIEALNGEKILKKCADVPLAIRVIGSSLRGQSKTKWMHMINTDLASQSNEDIVPVLKISYYDLPLHLKRCFTYCAIFPKDYEINKEELISLWMAQGFIKPNGHSLEDVGEEYFMNLLERCFFQDVKQSNGGEIISCKMHDLIHDVAKNIAGSEMMLVRDNTRNLKPEVRHIFIENEVLQSEDTIRFCTQMRKMRSLLRKKHHYTHRFILNSIEISKVRNLRVLYWPTCDMKKLPNMIGGLMHLRYLDLSQNSLRLLPPSITNLFNLQTLKLRYCGVLEKLPKDLVKLVNLRCLDLQDCNSLKNMPPGMRNMTCLHKLTMFILGCNKRNKANLSRRIGISGLEDLKCLKSLTGTLQIRILGDWMYEAEKVKEGGYISEMEQLKGIEIEFSDTKENSIAEALLEGLQPNRNLQVLKLIAYPDVRFPTWGMRGGLSKNMKVCLPNLVEIHFCNCSKLEHLPSMGQCPKLRVLNLTDLTNLEYVESHIDEDGTQMEFRGSRQERENKLVFFPSLQILELENLPKLKGWGLDSNLYAFPQLHKLTIKYCDKLTTFPLCLNARTLHIAVEFRSEVLSFYDNSEGKVEINSVNVGYIFNSLPADILQHFPYLTIRNWNDIKRILTGEVFQIWDELSLLSLEICKCKELRRLSELGEMWGHLTALETLHLIELPELELELNEEDDISSSRRECKAREGDNSHTAFDMPWRILAPTLCSLTLWKLPKLVKLPRGMHHLTSLHTLHIVKCYNLEELPAWIGCFSSLHSLHIYVCKKLRTLPQEMCHLTSVQYLVLESISEELEERCQKPSGSDWPKIQHIPNIRKNGERLQGIHF